MDKLLRILFVFLIALMPMAGVFAQDEDVFCGTLADTDCDILRASLAADASLTSMTYQLHMIMSILQDAPDAELQSFTINSAGALSYDKADLDAMTDEILNTTIGEVLKLIDEPDKLIARLVGYAERLAKAPTAEINVELILPEDIETAMQRVSADIKMTDGVIYLTSPLLETMELPPEAWVSLDLVQAVNMLATLLQDPAFIEGMMGGMEANIPSFAPPAVPEPGGETAPAADMQDMFARITAIANAPYWKEMESPEFMAQTRIITRLADSEIDGVSVAVFEDRVDMAAMVASEPFQQAFSDMFDMFAQDTSPEELEAIKPVILDMLASMELSSTTAIGLEDHFTYDVDISWEMTVDPQAFIAATVPDEDQADIPESALAVQTQTFEFHQEIRDHNQPVEVTPPPEENVISLLEMLMSGVPPA